MSNKTKFIIKSSLIGLGSFFLLSVLTAVIMVQIFSSDHPHSMEEALYVIIPALLTPGGLIVGLISGFVIKDFSTKKLISILAISFLAEIVILTAWFFIQI